MVFVHPHRTHDDVDFRLLDLVERLAAQFEGELGIRPVVDEVQRARDRLRLEELDEADHLDRIESLAHDALAALAARGPAGHGLGPYEPHIPTSRGRPPSDGKWRTR